MVSASRVRGEAVKASPAKTTRPTCPSSFLARISSTLNLARAIREGLISVTSIELDKSKTMTRAELV